MAAAKKSKAVSSQSKGKTKRDSSAPLGMAERGGVMKAEKAFRTGPKEVFLQLMGMAMLYISVISLVMLSFAYIDLSFMDPLANGFYGSPFPSWQSSLDTIRLSSAMLAVSFPLLLLFSWLIQRDLRRFPQKHELRFAKWLVYLTLLASSITLVVDLIQIVHRFYSGELSLPFGLKALSILVLAGAVLGYYLWDVQSQPQKSKLPAAMAWVASVLVLGMLALGFLLAGSPAEQRQVRMDERRVNDLAGIDNQTKEYWRLKRALPASLEELKNSPVVYGFFAQDPQTQEAYDYAVTGELSFRLCAAFDRPTSDFRKLGARPNPYQGEVGSDWVHGAGKTCFDRTIDPDFYPSN